MTTKSKLPRWLAIHEAGHVIGHWHVGNGLMWFDRVIVRTREEVAAGPYVDERGRDNHVLGCVEGGVFYNSECYLAHQMGRELPIGIWADLEVNDPKFSSLVSGLQNSMRSEVVCRLAGPIAEAKFRHTSLMVTTNLFQSSDFQVACHCINDFCRTKAEHAAMLKELTNEAVSIVSRHWVAVNAVADALLARRSLTADEATEVICGAYGLEREQDLAA